MDLDIYFVDAFSNRTFAGNPAAVIYTSLNDDNLMQNIAAENNLSETAFINISDSGNFIRWFSPTKEVDLCGHATLASAFIYFNFINTNTDIIEFESNGGLLRVNKKDNFLELDFPKDTFSISDNENAVCNAVGLKPIETYMGEINLMAVYDNEEQILNLEPNFKKIIELEGQGLIVTAPGTNHDFVSRYFCPKYGVNEDPVTGSAHTTLIPYWSDKLAKKKLLAKQVSKRGGELFCEDKDERVLIGGNAVLYMKGRINIS